MGSLANFFLRPVDARRADDVMRPVRGSGTAPSARESHACVTLGANVYVFGFFDAKPGGQLPWYLRPAITFPTMVGFVLVLAWLTGVMGGVTIQREAFGLERLVPETVAEAMK